MVTVETYDPREPSRGTAAQAVARHNTASMALLAAIEETLRPAHGSTWADAGDAQRVASGLLAIYVAMTDREAGDVVELPTDSRRGPTLRIEVRDR